MSTIERRSANYKPSIWNDKHLQSLNSIYGEERFLQRAEKLKGDVIVLLDRTEDPVDQIEIVDLLQRLGIFYHFTEKIDMILENLEIHGDWNLHATALSFRLLRQHGYKISTEVFRNYMDDGGKNFKTTLCDDIKGVVSLYEASYLLIEGEEGILEEAREFSAHHLKQKLLKETIDKNLADEIEHALEVPFHYRMLRLETMWFIVAYEKRPDMNPIMLELAKLDFNMVQAMYQDELKELSRWYTKTRLAEKMIFARDRLVEGFLWTVGFTFEPCFRYCRIMSVKLAVLITIIDDIYDVYGTLDELEILFGFRWDINAAMEQLPEYMKICFLALLEAKWYYSGYKPSLDEYLSNGWVSISGPVLIVHAYFCITNPPKDKSLDDLKIHPEILKWTSLICRLTDDLRTSTDELKRGDNPKSIQCYMHDTGCSEEDSRAHIKNLIDSTWKKINEDALMTHEHSRNFILTSINFARISQCMYQYGHGNGTPDRESKAHILTLVMEPFPLP